MEKKLSKQLNKFWYQFRVLWNTKSIDRLLKEAGVDVSPEEDTWGILSKAEEDIVLARLYADKLWVALMRKYAEGANKSMIQDIKRQDWHEASRHNGQFFSYNNQIVKAKRANKKQKEDANKDNHNQV